MPGPLCSPATTCLSVCLPACLPAPVQEMTQLRAPQKGLKEASAAVEDGHSSAVAFLKVSRALLEHKPPTSNAEATKLWKEAQAAEVRPH